jgi:DNA polymerase-3 subunit alpha
MFGGGDEAEIPEPALPECEPWANMDQLNRERDVVGVYISGHPLDAFRFEMEYLTTKGGLEILDNMDKHRGRKMNFGGLVSKVEHRISKSGRPWGKFSLEDYQGFQDFTLFGEDYINLKDYLVEGWMVMMTGSPVRKRTWGDMVGDPGSEFKINRLDMLATSREKRLERVRININLNALTSDWVDGLELAIKGSLGKVGLTVDIFDGEHKLEMPSRGAKVDVTPAFLNELDALCVPGVAKYRFDLKKG